jgi:hypothetical protein
MIIRKSNFGSSRRQFLKNALPAGALLCFGCNYLFAIQQAENKQQVDTEKHPFLQDAGMTAQEVFQFAYQMNLIPHMKKFQKYMGKEKYIEMVKKANLENMEELTTSMLKNMRRKADLNMFKIMTKSPIPPYNLAKVYEIVEDTDKVYELKITECLWAKTFREADAAEIGYAFMCYSGEPEMFFNPKIKFYNPKNLMKGDDICIYRYVWEG